MELLDGNQFTREKEKNPLKMIEPHGPFAAVPLLEYGGLIPILPFLGGRSDAARRVVINVAHHLVRMRNRRWAGNSRPAPTQNAVAQPR